MTTNFLARFESECIPRIIEAITGLYRHRVQLEVLPPEKPDRPARVRIYGDGPAELRRYACPLDITLAWDGLEVETLFSTGGDKRFADYLAALPGKLRAWQEPRRIDFGSLSQADPTVLIGGLDFKH